VTQSQEERKQRESDKATDKMATLSLEEVSLTRFFLFCLSSSFLTLCSL
jgi:hypothetical protein